MSDRKPTLAQVIRQAVDTRIAGLRVAVPGRVESFDPVTQTANIQPLLKDSYEQEDGSEAVENLPVVTNTPVVFHGGGNFAITFPVQVGDLGMLVFCDRSIDQWLELGGIVDPVDPRRHELSDGVFILGVRNKSQKLADFDSNRAVFGKQGGVRLAVTASEMHHGVGHGESATEKMVLGSAYRAAEDSLNNSISVASAAMVTAYTALINPTTGLGNATIAASPTSIAGLLVTAFTAVNTQLGSIISAIGTFQGASATYLSNVNKLK